MASGSTVDVELETLIRARYPIIYIVSWEERRVEETLREICQRRGKKMLLWTYTTGMAGNVASRDPLAALDYIMGAPDQSVFVLKDFHPFIGDVAVTRRLRDLIYILKTSYKTLILLSPLLKLPPELEKEVTVVDYQLPTPADLDRLLEGIIQSVRSNPQVKTEMTTQEREQVIQAASGLTSNEAENVFAKSLVEKRGFDVDVILSEKEQIIRKSGILEYYRATEAFADVGGMDLLKQWMQQRTASFSEEARRYGLPEPRGILLLGVQGGGKSLLAKSIASLWKLPLLRLDVGKIFAGIVGSSEENMRKAIATAESVAPCVAGDTRITLADGSEKIIRELYEGGQQELTVLGMSADGQIVPVRVKAVTRRPAPDLFHVRLMQGELQATGNHLHPVLRDGELLWTRTDALRRGDRVAVPRRIPTGDALPKLHAFLPRETRLYVQDALAYARAEVQTPQRRYAARKRGGDYVKLGELADMGHVPPFDSVQKFVTGRGGTTDSFLTRLPETLTPDMGYLLGLINSDGYLARNGRRAGFVNTDLTLHHRFAMLMHRLFGIQTVTRPATTDPHETTLRGTSNRSIFRPCYVTYADNRLLVSLLREIVGQLLTLPRAVLIAYVRGYFDGDGCISDPATGADPKVTLTCKRPEENHRLRAVLQRIGFLCGNPGAFNIEITGIDNVLRFVEEIGSDHPCRRERMEEWLIRDETVQKKDRTDLIPVGALLREARRSVGMASHHFASAASSLIHRYETGGGHPNRARLAALLAEIEARLEVGACSPPAVARLRTLVDSPVCWSPVRSVETAETPEFVYDLACECPHTFIANGIVTHNCVLWIDELEKGFSGTQSSGVSDGGTTSRVFGTFITWLNEKKQPVFVVATSNDVTSLPPELLRKGRFDEIFFVDLPSADERQEIFSIHLKKRKRDPVKFDLVALADASIGFSGAEIEMGVVEALHTSYHDGERELTTDDVLKAVWDTVPLSVTMAEGIDHLREWAETRARPSSSEEAESTDVIIRAEAATRTPVPAQRRKAKPKYAIEDDSADAPTVAAVARTDA